ncbi:MAG: InlB B-repeat-containing protein, partial [Lachnospiraceae bacterium]|nr:InlB B-repeat-containing protein [Candidatus Hippenecus merdae]
MPEKIPGQKATCTADGWNDYYQCQGEGSCSAYFADFKCTSKIENLDDWKTGTGKIPAAGHKAVMIPQKDATTEADGYKAHWYCTICSTYFKDDSGSVGALIGNAEALASWKTGDGRIPMAVPPHVHTPELVNGQAATCTADGWNDYYQCQGEGSCNAYFADFKCTSKIENLDDWKTGTGKIPAAGHKAVMIPQKDATTEADGYKAHWYCTACSTYFKDASGSVGTEIGNAEALASWKNGEGRIEKTKPHAHAYGTATYLWGEDLSTCTAYHTCTEAACGHTEFETGTVTEESGKMKATFTNPAFETQTKAKPTPGHTHTFSGVWSTNEAAHWHAATCEHTDLAKDMAAHAWGTGDNTNKCTVCGYEKTSPEPEKVLVSFNTDGGSFVNTQVVAKGQKAARPADPAKSGYVFVDWFTNTDRTNVYDFSTAVSADITLFAKWQKNVGREYTITWKDWNGTILATSKVVESGLPDYPGTSNPSRSGYIFTGWTPKIGLATADQMYTAAYAPQTIISGGGSSSGNSTPAAKKPTVTFSSNWFTNELGVWRIKNSAGQVVTNAWLCDDAVAANGQNVWYLLTQDGAMLAAGLVQDNTGNFYSLETNH